MTARRAPAPAPAPYPYPVPRGREGEQGCSSTDTELFFPPENAGPSNIAAAKQLCEGCPFREGCLAYALDRPSLYGVWGGSTRRERNALRRGTAAA